MDDSFAIHREGEEEPLGVIGLTNINKANASAELSVIVGEEVRVGDMLEVVASLRSPMLAEWRVFDVYEGAQVPPGKKSVALNFTFQAEETLNDVVAKEELDRISERLREAFGAEVRSG